jgi:hypothetical protein
MVVIGAAFGRKRDVADLGKLGAVTDRLPRQLRGINAEVLEHYVFYWGRGRLSNR